jgi:hypothetical protein
MGCERRKLNCHGFCNEYQAFSEWREEIRQKKASEKVAKERTVEHEKRYRESLKKGLRNK